MCNPQMAYIMAVNANIIADTGGPCSSKDCTVRCAGCLMLAGNCRAARALALRASLNDMTNHAGLTLLALI